MCDVSSWMHINKRTFNDTEFFLASLFHFAFFQTDNLISKLTILYDNIAILGKSTLG